MFSYESLRLNARLKRYKIISREIFEYAVMLKALEEGVLESGIASEDVYTLFRKYNIIPESQTFTHDLSFGHIENIIPLVCKNMCESELISDNIYSMHRLFTIGLSQLEVATRYRYFFSELGIEYAGSINIPSVLTTDLGQMLKYYVEGGV